MEYKTRIDQGFSFAGFSVWFICHDRYKGQTGVAKPMALEFEMQKSDAFPLPEPSLRLPYEMAVPFLKSILEAMEENAFVLSKEKMNNRQVEAMKDHLNDMKRMAERLLNIVETGVSK